jgi:hypothetical protein
MNDLYLLQKNYVPPSGHQGNRWQETIKMLPTKKAKIRLWGGRWCASHQNHHYHTLYGFGDTPVRAFKALLEKMDRETRANFLSVTKI